MAVVLRRKTYASDDPLEVLQQALLVVAQALWGQIQMSLALY